MLCGKGKHALFQPFANLYNVLQIYVYVHMGSEIDCFDVELTKNLLAKYSNI